MKVCLAKPHCYVINQPADELFCVVMCFFFFFGMASTSISCYHSVNSSWTIHGNKFPLFQLCLFCPHRLSSFEFEFYSEKIKLLKGKRVLR